MTHFPGVSIVVPTFNRGYCIGSCLESALAQTYGEFELIVVDDASSDDTAVRVKSLKDSRVRYLRHDVNRGGAAARNTGIHASTGEFVAFLDSDDVWHPEKVEEQVAALRQLGPAWGLSYTWMSSVDSSGAEVSRTGSTFEGNCSKRILLSNFIASFSNVVVRRSVLLQCGQLDEGFKSCQDWDLYIRVGKQSNFHCLKKCVVSYRHTGTDIYRISTNHSAVMQGHRRILKKYAADYEALPPSDAREAYTLFMNVFAETGSVSDVIRTAWLRSRRGVLASDLRDASELFVRASRRKAGRKVRSWLRSEARRNAGVR